MPGTRTILPQRNQRLPAAAAWGETWTAAKANEASTESERTQETQKERLK